MSNNVLTAATQYTDFLYVPEIAQKKEQIKELIVQYWKKVKGGIKAKSYTMDLALEPNLEHIYIIELNDPVSTFPLLYDLLALFLAPYSWNWFVQVGKREG